MNRLQTLLLASLFSVACAGGAVQVFQADHERPKLGELDDDQERALIKDVAIHSDRADLAATSGNMDQARAEWKEAADGWVHYADKYPQSEWRVVARRVAADLYLRSDEPAKAGEQAQLMGNDPEAKEATKIYAARVATRAYLAAAFADVKATKLEALKPMRASQRQGQDPKPRPLADQWKKFISSADALAALAPKDPATYALGYWAGVVEFTYDNVEDARARFEKVIVNATGTTEAVDAVAFYLDTFLLLKDIEAYNAALDRMIALYHPEVQKAQDAAKLPTATPEQKKLAEAVAKLDEELAKEKKGSGFDAAKRLLDQNKPAEAAAAFEKFADDNKGHPNSPPALFNAGVAWEKAGDAKKAAAARERVWKEYPDHKLAGQAMLASAQGSSKAKDHAGAVKLYQTYVEKFPTDSHRCAALLNMGVEYDEMKKFEDAANAYRSFGVDAQCAKEDANNAAKVLYRAGDLFTNKVKGKKAEVKATLKALAEIAGVTDAVAKSYQDDAKKKLKGMK